MSDLVAWAESTLDIAVCVKSKMTAILQGQTKNNYNFQQNGSR